MKKNNMIWNIILVVSLIMIVHGMSNHGDPDKKTAQLAQDETTAGSIGAVASFIGKKGIVWYAYLGIAAAIPFIIKIWSNNIVDIFRPSPEIPVWVWIIGFALIAMMILRRRD